MSLYASDVPASHQMDISLQEVCVLFTQILPANYKEKGHIQDFDTNNCAPIFYMYTSLLCVHVCVCVGGFAFLLYLCTYTLITVIFLLSLSYKIECCQVPLPGIYLCAVKIHLSFTEL